MVEMQLDIPIKNIDTGEQPPLDIYILPALFNSNGDLKAYGVDIVDFLKDPANKAPRLSLWKRMMNFVKDHC
jgi:hypothetical protein